VREWNLDPQWGTADRLTGGQPDLGRHGLVLAALSEETGAETIDQGGHRRKIDRDFVGTPGGAAVWRRDPCAGVWTRSEVWRSTHAAAQGVEGATNLIETYLTRRIANLQTASAGELPERASDVVQIRVVRHTENPVGV
jgi:hypothetical protein